LALLERSDAASGNGEPPSAAAPEPEPPKEAPKKDETTRITVY
jgi:hypothetical protein